MKRNIEAKRETVPIIFQVRSSRASFLRSIFSSRSVLNFSAGGLAGAFLFGFSGFSCTSSSTVIGSVDFFSLLAIKTNIRLDRRSWGGWRILPQNNSYFFRIPIRNKIHPTINKSPPIGVIIPTPGVSTLFIAFRDTKRYKEPENRTTPPMKKAPA